MASRSFEVRRVVHEEQAGASVNNPVDLTGGGPSVAVLARILTHHVLKWTAEIGRWVGMGSCAITITLQLSRRLL